MTRTNSAAAASASRQWCEYLRWNAWIAEAFYPETGAAPIPVYLDFDGEPAERLAKLTGHASTRDLEASMVEVVRSTLPRTGKKLFHSHEHALRVWAADARRALRGDPEQSITPPPVLPLLLSFVLAAEQMRGDGEMGSSNYYGRLAKVLERGTEDLRSSYQASAERTWGALNAWLVELDGARGLPSAYSVSSFRYVGIAVSQALVREADRSALPSFFEFADLAPSSDLPPEALQPLLQAWAAASNGGATQQLRRLIDNDSTRARVAEVASVELSAWHGSDSRSRTSHRPQLARPVTLRLQFHGVPLRQPRFTPILKLRSEATELYAQLVVGGGDHLDLSLERLSAGTYAPPRSSVPPAGDLLQSRLRYFVGGASLERAPTPAVVFRSDEFGVEFWETSTVVRGERLHVLLRAEFAAAFERVLEEVAPTTWRRIRYSGLPNDWALFEDVEVLRAPSRTTFGETKWLADLLTPVTSHHLSLHDGFRMPGAVRHRWLESAPPLVTASSDSADGFTVTIDRIPEILESIDLSEGGKSRERLLAARGTSAEPLAIALADLRLDAGTYEVSLTGGGRSASVLQRRQFTVVAPVARSTSDGVIGLDLREPLAALERAAASSATTVTEAGEHLIGAAHFGVRYPDGQVLQSAQSRSWTAPANVKELALPSLETAAPGSCFYTGAHRWHLETPTLDRKGRPAVEWSPGTCKTCGVTKLFQNNAWKVTRKDAETWSPRYNAITAPKREEPEHDARLGLAVEALAAVGSGDGRALRLILAQVDSSALAVHRIIHDLTAIGTLSVVRDETTGDVTSWSLAPATIVSTSNRALLTSFWSADSVAAIEGASRSSNSVFERESTGMPSTMISTDMDDDALWAIAEGLDHEVQHAGPAARELAFALSPLGAAIDAVPRKPMPHGGEYEMFNPRTASWQRVATPSAPGAYRSGTYSREYFVRTSKDVAADSRAVVDAATSKHAAALIGGAAPLLYWDASSETLRTPLGSPLPGLFGRAAALAAVRMPYRHRDELVYDSVPDDVADRLTYLLTH